MCWKRCTISVKGIPVDNRLALDLDQVLAHAGSLWETLRGQRIFITGGTGFIGCWILESLVWANRKLRLNAQATVLTRDMEAFNRKAPHLAQDPCIELIYGDVLRLPSVEGIFPFIIHAAADPGIGIPPQDPVVVLNTIVEGTRNIMDFAACCKAKAVLFVSSGAVYGRQPDGLSHIPEDYAGGPDVSKPESAYGEGKRCAELLAVAYGDKHGIQTKIARCFTFVGPYLPLDRQFAVGNFIRDALGSGPISVNDDGSACRSYLYASDLAVWLWAILIKGQTHLPYNVGSNHAVSIAELAHCVARICGGRDVHIRKEPKPGAIPARYVPDISRASGSLGLKITVPLADAIGRTLQYYRTTA